MIFAQYYMYYPICPCTSLGVESKVHLELKLGWEMKKITRCKSAKNCSYSDGHVRLAPKVNVSLQIPISDI